MSDALYDILINRMDSVLKALTRNRLGSENDQEKQEGNLEDGTGENGQNSEMIDTNPGRLLSGDFDDQEKKLNVSIDCTKALVIFGFSNWSELEPGVCLIFITLFDL